jgi:hypothetical protein
MKKFIVSFFLLNFLCGCAAMSDPNSFWYIPPLTPEQACNGEWKSITTYNADGTNSVTGKCIENSRQENHVVIHQHERQPDPPKKVILVDPKVHHEINKSKQELPKEHFYGF